MSDRQNSQPATVSVAEAVAQIGIAVERLAMLHYHYARRIVEELGEERGRKLISDAIAAYGREIGERHRRKTMEAGVAASVENYKTLPDLPTLAWTEEFKPVRSVAGRPMPICPLAAYWMDVGAESLGRLYCYVDQAKYAAFDPECECRHLKNVLDGDEGCQIVAKKRWEWEELDRRNG